MLCNLTVALCADLGTCGALDTPAAFAECVRMLTSTSVELKKSAEGGFGEQLQHAIAKDHAVPKLLVYFKRVERAIAEANTGKIVLSKKCFVVVMCMSSLLVELHCSRLTLLLNDVADCVYADAQAADAILLFLLGPSF